jgi:WD40 repeat protein
MTESGDHSFGKYQIEAEIGRGGFGTVYRALDTGLERQVALKILDPLLMRDNGWVMSFRKEARVTARLEHPHIVPVYEIGEERERLFIAMKLIEGGSLATHILQKGALSWEESLRIVQEVASALDFAHGRQVAHRDLKPGNILLGPDGCVLTDFGFARLLGDNSMSLSLSGGVVGTPPYMAPEIWEGRRDAGKQADVYALGCILYEMVTGQVLFNGDTPPAIMLAHFKPLALPATWPVGVPAGLGEILSVALSQEPDTRYAGAGEMAQALGRLVTDCLAGPYQALEEALAAGEWETALQIAGSIRAQNTGYRDVRALAEKAAAGRERAQRAAWAGQWQQQAEAALAEGNLAGARTAALQWQKMAPEDEKAHIFLANLAEADDKAKPVAGEGKAVANQPAVRNKAPATGSEAVSRPFAGARKKDISTGTPTRHRLWIAAFFGFGLLLLIICLIAVSLIAVPKRAPVALLSPTITPAGLPVAAATSAVLAPTQTATRIPTLTAINTPVTPAAPAATPTTTRMPALAVMETAVMLIGRGVSVYGGQFSPDGQIILTADNDGTARLWDRQGNELAVLRRHEERVWSAVFSPDGQTILTAHDDGTARLWDRQGNELAVLRGHEDEVWSAVFSPDGQTILTASWDHTARLWDRQGRELAVLLGHEDNVWSAVLSPDGQTILTDSSDRTARLWDRQGNELAVLRGHEQWVYLAVFSPDGQTILTAGFDGTARLWDRQGNELAVLRAHVSGAWSAVFSPDGQAILTGTKDYTARLWDRQGNELAVLRGHEELVRSAAFSPDGQTILTASWDHTARMWDRQGRELAVLLGHEDFVWSAVLSPDGQTILTASSDGTARLWDRQGNELAVLRGHEERVWSAVFSPDGQTILTGSDDGTARLWLVSRTP